jgi:bla regulator protein blaR1
MRSLVVCALLIGSTLGARSAAHLQTERLQFEVASVKLNIEPGDNVVTGGVTVSPGGRLLTARAAIPRFLIQRAFGVRPEQIIGGPGWLESTHYNIEAKATGSATMEQLLQMLQSLLEDRFKLKVHHEMKEMTVFDLTVAKNGLKLPPPRKGSCTPVDPTQRGMGLPQPQRGRPADAPRPCGRVFATVGPSSFLRGGNVSMSALIFTLSNLLGRTIIDKTGYAGTFDVDLTFARDESLAIPSPPPRAGAPARAPDPNGVSIFTAMQEQLGLQLSSAKGPVDVIVIDHIEKPAL